MGSLLVRHVVGFVLNFGGTILLVRSLGPSLWGVYGIAYVVQFGLHGILERGTAGYLIQRRTDPTAEQIGGAISFQLGVGALAGVVLILLSPFAVTVFSSREIAPLLLAVAMALVFYAVRAVPLGILERRLAYSRVGAIELADIATFNAVALVGVLLGFGISSLAVATGSRAVISTLLAWRFAMKGQKVRSSRRSVRELLAFAAPYSGSNALLVVNAIAAPVLVGTIAGVRAFGFLQLANSLIQYPVSLNWILARVAFPAYSRIGADPDTVRTSVEAATRIFLRFIGTGTLVVACTSAFWVPAIFGDQWIAVAPIMIIVAPPLALYGAFTFVTAGLNARGYVGAVLVIGLAFTLVYLPAAALLVPPVGVIGMPVAFSLATITVLAYLVVFRRTIGALKLRRELAGFACCSSLLIVVAWAFNANPAGPIPLVLAVAIGVWPLRAVQPRTLAARLGGLIRGFIGSEQNETSSAR